jgi:hypothetical protein
MKPPSLTTNHAGGCGDPLQPSVGIKRSPPGIVIRNLIWNIDWIQCQQRRNITLCIHLYSQLRIRPKPRGLVSLGFNGGLRESDGIYALTHSPVEGISAVTTWIAVGFQQIPFGKADVIGEWNATPSESPARTYQHYKWP